RLYGDAAERFRCQVVERSAPLLVELSERTGLVADLSILDGDQPGSLAQLHQQRRGTLHHLATEALGGVTVEAG
ncbi:hypothetical protein ACV330_30045, partial [Pseudomonas aeruginosa]